MALPPEIQQELDSLSRRIDRLSAELSQFRDPTTPSISLTRDLHDLGEVAVTYLTTQTDQTFASATVTKVAFDARHWDTNGWADLANDRIGVKEDGLYLAGGWLEWAGDATGYRRIEIRAVSPSGSPFPVSSILAPPSSSGNSILTATGVWPVDVHSLGQYNLFEMVADQGTVGNLNSLQAHLWVVRVGGPPPRP